MQYTAFNSVSSQRVISSHKDISELNFSFFKGLHKGKKTKFEANL